MKRPTEAWMTPNFEEAGIGHVVVARFKGSGDAEAGVFLVDSFCLGVKNAFFVRLPIAVYEERLLNKIFSHGGRIAVAPSTARAFVEQAVAYAMNLGLAPHRDYQQAARVFGGIDAEECKETFRFGDGGKPCYIQGPNDNESYIRRVLECLVQNCGAEFNYMLEARSLTPEIEALIARVKDQTGLSSRVVAVDESTREAES